MSNINQVRYTLRYGLNAKDMTEYQTFCAVQMLPLPPHTWSNLRFGLKLLGVPLVWATGLGWLGGVETWLAWLGLWLGVVVLVELYCALPIFMRRFFAARLQRQFHQPQWQYLWETRTLEFSPQGLLETTTHRSQHIAWSQVQELHSTHQHWFARNSGGVLAVVPAYVFCQPDRVCHVL